MFKVNYKISNDEIEPIYNHVHHAQALKFLERARLDYLEHKGIPNNSLIQQNLFLVITEISIKRPSLIIVLFSVFALLGIIVYQNLSYELLPDFNQPVVVIKTIYPGAEPQEVETSVSRKIEDALSNLEGVDYLETKSVCLGGI